MRKRGFIGSWQNRHWAEVYDFFSGDTNNAPFNSKYLSDKDLPKQPAGTIKSILERANMFKNSKYVWGGATVATSDCSFYVSYCYGTDDEGSHTWDTGMIGRVYTLYGEWGSVTPKNGMILWNGKVSGGGGHVGLYMDGQLWDMGNSRVNFRQQDWSERPDMRYVLYSEKIDYDDVD